MHNKRRMAITLEQTSNHNNRKNSARVSFDDSSTKIHETIHVTDFTENEKHACWLSLKDLARNKLEVKSMARKFLSQKQFKSKARNNVHDDDDILAKECSKKIEIQYTDQQQEIRQLIRRQAQLAVFEEQEYQWMTMTTNNTDDEEEEGDKMYYNDERIASVYQKQTMKSHQQAQKIGQAMGNEVATATTSIRRRRSSSSSSSLHRSYSDSESESKSKTSLKKRIANFTRSKSLGFNLSRY